MEDMAFYTNSKGALCNIQLITVGMQGNIFIKGECSIYYKHDLVLQSILHSHSWVFLYPFCSSCSADTQLSSHDWEKHSSKQLTSLTAQQKYNNISCLKWNIQYHFNPIPYNTVTVKKKRPFLI